MNIGISQFYGSRSSTLNNKRPLLSALSNTVNNLPPERSASITHSVGTALAQPWSNKAKGQPPSDIWTGLYATYQYYPSFGRDDHDDWVASIKAAMSGLGQSPLSIFDEVTATAKGYNITMKDGFKLHISNEEMTMASQYAKFSGYDESMVKDARFLFAVMNKRKHIEYQYDQKRIGQSVELKKLSFGAVLKSADEGISGYNGLRLLGLDQQLQIAWSHNAGNQVAVPAGKVFLHKRGMITGGFMESYGYKKQAPKWIESLIVLKQPHTSMPTPLVSPKPPKPFTFNLEPLPGSKPEAPVEIPELSPKRNGQKPDDPMLGIYTRRPYIFQGDTATHADTIKLLMSRYGQSPTDVFSNVKFVDNLYHVTFRDGFALKFSTDELQLAEEHSLFKGDDEGMLDDANFIFAAYIKRQQLQPPKPSFGLSFEAALLGNLHGRTVKNILEGMGVTSSIKYIERAGDAEGLVLLSKGTAGGLFKDGEYAEEGKYYPEDGATQTQGYQLS